MSKATLADRKATSPGPASRRPPRPLGPRDVLILAAWCGLAAWVARGGHAGLVPEHQPQRSACTRSAGTSSGWLR